MPLHLTSLPTEVLRLVFDRLDTRDQASLACTGRDLYKASRCPSTSRRQRFAAMFRDASFPWKRLSEKLPPVDFHSLAGLGHELCGTKKGQRSSRYWVFDKRIRHYGLHSKQVISITEPKPQRHSRRLQWRERQGDISSSCKVHLWGRSSVLRYRTGAVHGLHDRTKWIVTQTRHITPASKHHQGSRPSLSLYTNCEVFKDGKPCCIRYKHWPSWVRSLIKETRTQDQALDRHFWIGRLRDSHRGTVDIVRLLRQPVIL